MQQLLDRPVRLRSKQRHYQTATDIQHSVVAPRIARAVGFGARNRVLVRLPEASESVLSARLLKGISRDDLWSPSGEGQEVLVVFDAGDLEKPVVVGLLASEDEETSAQHLRKADSITDSKTPPQQVVIEALAELMLKCGSGSITLRKDGKIVLRGTHLLARASGPIRIKGGHVEIN
jgi:hypothetical protein